MCLFKESPNSRRRDYLFPRLPETHQGQGAEDDYQQPEDGEWMTVETGGKKGMMCYVQTCVRPIDFALDIPNLRR